MMIGNQLLSLKTLRFQFFHPLEVLSRCSDPELEVGIIIFFTHLKLYLAAATQNLKWALSFFSLT